MDLSSAISAVRWIVGATIPFALFFAVIILVLRGESAQPCCRSARSISGLIVDAHR